MLPLLSLILIFAGSFAQADETHALAMAHADAQSVRLEDRIFTRWLWIPPHMAAKHGEEECVQATVLTLNFLSWGTPFKPFAIKDKVGNVMLRWNIKDLALDPNDAKEVDALVKAFEELQYDPAFNLLLTKDTLRFAAELGFPAVAAPVAKTKAEAHFDRRLADAIKKNVPLVVYVAENPPTTTTIERAVVIGMPLSHAGGQACVEIHYPDGSPIARRPQWSDAELIVAVDAWLAKRVAPAATAKKDEPKAAAAVEVELVRQVAGYLDKKQVAELIDGTQSIAPIVSAPYFIARVTRSIKDTQKNKVYATIYGGMYYEVSGTPKTEKELLAKLGVPDLKVFDKLQSDRRAWMQKSLVTKNERLIEAIPTLASGLDKTAYYLVTRDRNRSSIDLSKSARLNLFTFKEDGSEVMFGKQNGLPGYVILDGNRKVVDEVPNDIATDTSKPPGANSMALESMISCLSCHAKNNGFLPIKDSLRDRLASGRVSIYDDLNVADKDALIRRIRSWADADFEAPNGIMSRARSDFGIGVMRATGPWKSSVTKPPQLDIVRLSSEKIAEIFNSYLYDDIDAGRALAELGVTLDKGEKAAEKLKALTAPPLNVRQDRRIIDLYEGDAIARTEFDLIRSILATQIRRKQP